MLGSPPLRRNIEPMHAHRLTEKILSLFKEVLMHRAVIIAARRRKFLKLPSLFAIQPGRHLDDYSNAQIPSVLGVHVLYAMTAEAELRSALGSSRDFQQSLTLNRRHFRLA